MLNVQQKEGVEPVSLSVEDPASEEFYINTWMKTAHSNTELFQEVRKSRSCYHITSNSILAVR